MNRRGWKEITTAGLVLEPGSAIEYETGSWRTFRPIIDMERCTHCMFCWVYCPDASIVVKDGKVTGVDLRHCKGCGICARECPLEAVTMVEEAKAEMRRTLAALGPALARGATVVGLEPSCLLTFRDEAPALLGAEWTAQQAERVMLFEEFIAARLEADGGGFELPLAPLDSDSALLHGHCHQKAFGALGGAQRSLGLVPGLEIETVASSCCGMAGAFGYRAETYEVSMKMAELSLLPAVREADPETLVVADGISCRQQIAHGTGRAALHGARVLDMALRDWT